METVAYFIFMGPKITVDGGCRHKIKRHLLFGRKTMTNLGSILKSRDRFLNKDLYSQSYGFSSSRVWIWEMDYKEGWAWKNWLFQTVVLEKTLESPLDWKEIKPVNPERTQSWIFIGRTDAEAKAPIFWPTDAKNWLIGKDPDAGKDWKQEEDEMVGWHHQHNGHSLSKLWEIVKDWEASHSKAHWVTNSPTWLSDWTTSCHSTLKIHHRVNVVCQASVCSSVLSRHNKDLEWQTLKPSARCSSWVLDKPCYSS